MSSRAWVAIVMWKGDSQGVRVSVIFRYRYLRLPSTEKVLLLGVKMRGSSLIARLCPDIVTTSLDDACAWNAMSEEDNVRVVRRLVDAINTNDLPRELMTEDVELKNATTAVTDATYLGYEGGLSGAVTSSTSWTTLATAWTRCSRRGPTTW
jgi:hypothetical protein